MSQTSPEDDTITRAMLQEYFDQFRPKINGKPDYTKPPVVTDNEMREWIIGHGVTSELEVEKFVGDRNSYL